MSIYTHPNHHRKGVASRLYGELLPYLESTDLHRAYAGITLPNDASVALHERFGFVRNAHYHEVGCKFDRYWDVIWLERSL